MDGLTDRQRQVLEFVRAYTKEHGYPPTRAEISKAHGFNSSNAAQQHLDVLEHKGFITLARAIARGIVIKEGR